jgi:periplasmic protein TonB
MLKLITQPNLTAPGPGQMNLRPGQSAPNFALARNVVSEGFLANLKCLLTERGVVIPGEAKGSAFLAQHFGASFVDNLKECFQPTPKFTGNAVLSLRGMASPGMKIESQPLYLSLFLNIRDIVIPRKLPPLELTSKPVEIPEIWSKHSKLSTPNVVSVILHVSFTVLVLAFTFRQVTDPVTVKSATVLIAPPAPGAPPPPARVATPTVTRRAAYTKRKSFFVRGKLTAPSAIPKVVRTRRSADDVGAPDLNLGGVPGGDPAGILGGVLGGEAGGIPGGVLGGISGAPRPPGAATTKSGVVRVGGNVKRPRPIYTPGPEFPSLARHAKVTGIVILDAVIDEHGNVAKLHAVSGNGLLINAALKAVAQWKFEPTYLNGMPVSVEMEVEVAFHLLN